MAHPSPYLHSGEHTSEAVAPRALRGETSVDLVGPTARLDAPLRSDRPTARLTAPVAEPVLDTRRRWRRVGFYAALAVVVACGAWLLVRALRPPALLVVPARFETVSRVLAVTGRVEAGQVVTVSAQSAGRITELVRREGDQVEQGAPLARLEGLSSGAVSQQSAALSARREQLDVDERRLGELEQLAQSGAVEGAQLEEARRRVDRGKQELVRLSAALKAQEAQLVLSAPIAGIIVRREADVGQAVGPERPVFEIAAVDRARVMAEVDQRYASALAPGMHAEVIPIGNVRGARSAKISYVAQAVDPKTGTVSVRLAYDSTPPKLLVGATVDINISVDRARSVIVPREALTRLHGHTFVMVVAGGRVERREVTVDDWPAEWLSVERGLRPGEQIALEPATVRAGAHVRPELWGDMF